MYESASVGCTALRAGISGMGTTCEPTPVEGSDVKLSPSPTTDPAPEGSAIDCPPIGAAPPERGSESIGGDEGGGAGGSCGAPDCAVAARSSRAAAALS